MQQLIKDWLLDPLALLFLLALLLTLLVWRRGGAVTRCASVLLLLGFLAASAPVVVNPLLASLEGEASDVAACSTPPDYIVLLTGGVDSTVRRAEEFERMSRATLARTARARELAEQWPDATLIISGGVHGRITEAAVVRQLLLAMGLPERQLLLEERSGNTAENAREVAALLDGSAGASLMLITSAHHMSRALLHFRTAGLNPCPIKVDFRAIPEVPLWAWMPQTTALAKFKLWLHEIVGLTVARLR